MARFCDRLKEALALRKMKPSVLSFRTGISEASISHYIAGHYEPKGKRVKLIANTLRVSEGWLTGYDVPMQEEQKEKSPLESELSEEIVVYHRDGKNVVKRFTPEQIRAIHAFLEAMPGETKEEK